VLACSSHSQPASFPVYGSSLSRDVSPRDLADKIKALHTDHAINAFKVKIAQRMGHNIDGGLTMEESLTTARDPTSQSTCPCNTLRTARVYA
jgi:hypothetical protein